MRDEKWGKIWREIEKIYVAVRGDAGAQKIQNEQRNFSVHPVKVFYSLFRSIQPECAAKSISTDGLIAAISKLDKSEYTNEPLGKDYIYAYQSVK